MKKIIILTIILLPLSLIGQTVEGKVLNRNGEPLIGASIYWLGKNNQVIANELGQFEVRHTHFCLMY